MAELETLAQQELAVDMKVESYASPKSETGTLINAPEAQEPITTQQVTEQWDGLKAGYLEDAKNFAIGVPANLFGTFNDLIALGTIVGYEGFDYILDGDFDFSTVPGGSEQIGELFGADVNSKAFLASAFTNPEGGVLQAVKALKGIATMAKGATGLGTVAHAITGGARLAESTPGGVARLSRAQEMDAAGADYLDVWNETSFYKDGDQWKFMLSDADAIIDMGPVGRQAPDGLKVGEEFSAQLSLGDVLRHDPLYKAFPEIGDVPLTVHARRAVDAADGTPTYEVFNRYAKDNTGINAQVQVNLFNTVKSMEVFNPAGGFFDNARTVFLHEANHIVQSKEGFDMGTSAQLFVDRVLNAKVNSVHRKMALDIQSGRVNTEMTPADMMRYASKIADEYKVPDTAIRPQKKLASGALDASDSPPSARDVFMQNLMTEIQKTFVVQEQGLLAGKLLHQETSYRHAMRDVRLMYEELGELGTTGIKMEDDIIETLTKQLSLQDLSRLAARRYRGQKGEIEARLAEVMADRTTAEIAALNEPPFTVKGLEEAGVTDVPATGPIVGDAARASKDLADLDDLLLK